MIVNVVTSLKFPHNLLTHITHRPLPTLVKMCMPQPYAAVMHNTHYHNKYTVL